MAETKDSISYIQGMLTHARREVELVQLVEEMSAMLPGAEVSGVEACIVAIRRLREADCALSTLRALRTKREVKP